MNAPEVRALLNAIECEAFDLATIYQNGEEAIDYECYREIQQALSAAEEKIQTIYDQYVLRADSFCPRLGSLNEFI